MRITRSKARQEEQAESSPLLGLPRELLHRILAMSTAADPEDLEDPTPPPEACEVLVCRAMYQYVTCVSIQWSSPRGPWEFDAADRAVASVLAQLRSFPPGATLRTLKTMQLNWARLADVFGDASVRARLASLETLQISVSTRGPLPVAAWMVGW
jgi:hypothetical protein